ncbi:MAG: FAD-dependent oxidoreductase, partial [Oscillospiraceae bacterium]
TFFYAPAFPFEIPLSALVPISMKNLIPSCKNIGCTHLTNGCYRLHPVEWNIGEVAGLFAAYCLDNNLTPAEVLETNVGDFQKILQQNGIQLHWDFEKMNL